MLNGKLHAWPPRALIPVPASLLRPCPPDVSQELLLSIVPPLHPIHATTSPSGAQQPLSVCLGDPAASVQQLLAGLPPLGHELVVEMVGIAADDRLQVRRADGRPHTPPTGIRASFLR